MAAKANIDVVVLWDNEIREAARLLHAWHDSKEGANQNELMASAFNACLVALWGVREGVGLVMLGSGDIKKLANCRPDVILDPSE